MDDVKRLIRRTARQLKSGDGEPDFFELVRRIENVSGNLPRVGYAHSPKLEVIRFGQTPYMRFPETTISEVGFSPQSGDTALIYVYFFGLLGVNGPMPLDFTNHVFQRSQNYYDRTLRRFLDTIHHKMLSFFYRAWAQNEQAVSFDRKDDDLIGDIVGSIAGSFDGMVNDILPKYTAHDFSRFLSYTVRSRDGLEKMLSSFFNLPIRILENIPSAHDIPVKFRCRLGDSGTAVLGRNMQVGGKYFSRSNKFIIEIGPIHLDLCRQMLPGSLEFDRLIELLNMYLSKPFEYDVKFLLSEDSPLKCSLDGSFALGRGAWIASDKCHKPELTLTIGASRLGAKHHKQSYTMNN